MFKLSLLIIAITGLIFINYCKAYKLLLIPAPAIGHLFGLATIGEQLTRNGHIVHFLIPHGFKMNDHLMNLTSSFQIERYGPAALDENTDYNASTDNITYLILEQKINKMNFLLTMREYIQIETRNLLTNNDELMIKLANEKFDVAVVDTPFAMKYPCLIPLRLSVPLITYADVLPHWVVRVPYLPSFVPARMLGAFTERMTFTERFINTLVELFLVTLLNNLFEPEEAVIKDYRKYGNFSTIDDVIAQSLLFITTSDGILDYPKPSMPNVIHAAGLSVKPGKATSLPQGIDKFMAESKKGVILVTFGSMVSSFPPEIVLKFASTFKRLGPDYRIIFRLNNRDNLTFTSNVLISRWLPQNEILSDARVKLFVTHCGNSGQYEAIYHGVPMIGFPLFRDQPYNAKRLEYKGFGIAMEIHSFTAEDLYQNIMTILSNQSYSNKVKRASEIYRSAKETPAERAAYWIDHVTRFSGKHLRSAGSDLHLYQYLLPDVLLVVIIIVTSFLVCLWKTLKLICSRLCCYKQDSTTKQIKRD